MSGVSRWASHRRHAGGTRRSRGRARPVSRVRAQPRTPHRCSRAATSRYGSVRPARSSAASSVQLRVGRHLRLGGVSVKTRTPYQACSGAPIPAERRCQRVQPVGPDVRPSRLVYAVGVEGGQRRRPVARPAPAASPARPRSVPAGTAARRARASAPARPAARPAPATYISTPWQSTTSKLPGRKCTPVSRPSPSTSRDPLRMPSGSAASASRATADHRRGSAPARSPGVRPGPAAAPACPGPCRRRAPAAAARPGSARLSARRAAGPPAPGGRRSRSPPSLRRARHPPRPRRTDVALRAALRA